MKQQVSRFLGGFFLCSLVLGCATRESPLQETSFDAGSRERAKPYLKGLYSLDSRFSQIKVNCSDVSMEADWKEFVASASACVQKQEWSQVEKLGLEMSTRHYDSPWGVYFLGLAAVARGEFLRAHWMFDLAEKKAGARLALVRYEKARLLEKENSFASAAKEMKEAVMLDPMLVSGHLWLAQVYHRDKILDEAEHYYRLALMARRDAFPALMGLAEILLEKNDGLEAASLLARASLLKPELFEIRIKLAHVYEKLTGEPEKALQALKELQAAIANGRIKGKVGIDLNSKINDLEKLLRPVPKEQAQELQPGRIPAHSKKGG